jgi:hypothetical protein
VEMRDSSSESHAPGLLEEHPQRDSNPCRHLERATTPVP